MTSKRRPDRIGQQGLLLRIDGLRGREARGRSVFVERLLGVGAAGPQHVQADVSDDRGQPAAHVAHVADLGTVHPQPRLLNRILGLGHRAKHSVGHRIQVRPMLLELIHRRLRP